MRPSRARMVDKLDTHELAGLTKFALQHGVKVGWRCMAGWTLNSPELPRSPLPVRDHYH
jgi:hypothetical protein